MKKSLIKLGIVALLIVVVAFLALNGLQVGKYILKPVSSAISLGLDLRGGVSTEYIATDTSVENYDILLDSTVSALRTRLTNAGFTEANVAVQGNDRILVEIPDVDDPEEVMEIIGTPAHLEFRDPNGNVVIEGKDMLPSIRTPSIRALTACIRFPLSSAARAQRPLQRRLPSLSISPSASIWTAN